MIPLRFILLATTAGLFALLVGGCENFSAADFKSVVGTLGNAYSTYDRTANPERYPHYYAPSPPP